MKSQTLFFRKLGKMSQNLSSAAVVIGVLRVNKTFFYHDTEVLAHILTISLLVATLLSADNL